ncbi:hypothetical protein CVT24_008795 [Panaeolus cyanescens]|uniref:Pectinesterase n=1 Tax=Panaeolus cyanescens TaxID=181874 RepID=A0A409VED1_9AGAR|nr:hypothetical protein CVT24_008795 [Panaeolus cyanescens]
MAGASPASGMFTTIMSAVSALPDDNSARSIFVYPGTYNEQVNITRSGPLNIYGFTTDTTTYTANTVTIQRGVPASVAGSNDLSGTLRIHKDDFRLYNINVKNTFGPGSQAIAISQYGSRVGLYACGFFGYQDTLYANQGTQVYLKSYIEGAVDFIFGRLGSAYFGGNTIAVKGPGYITASGRLSNDNGSCRHILIILPWRNMLKDMNVADVLEDSTIVLAADVVANTANRFFLGRPWGNFAKVIFKNTQIIAPINQTIWSIWNPGDERTDNVFITDYNTTVVGTEAVLSRPSWVKTLNATEARAFNIASAVGNDWAAWVDREYLDRE